VNFEAVFREPPSQLVEPSFSTPLHIRVDHVVYERDPRSLHSFTMATTPDIRASITPRDVVKSARRAAAIECRP